MKSLLITALVGIFLLAHHAPAETAAAERQATTDELLVTEAIQAAGFTIFAELIEWAGLADELNSKEFLTCFPPVDEAFANADMDRLQADAQLDGVKAMIRYHFVPGNMPEQVILISRRERTLSGKWITIWVNNGTIKMNNHATVIQADIKAANGIIHGVDKLIRWDVPGAYP